MTCFDSALVTISDGALLFRKFLLEFNKFILSFLLGTSDEQAASCSPIDGRFDVSYRMNDAALSCESGDGTTVMTHGIVKLETKLFQANNCESSSRIQIQFKNCSFPDFGNLT